jgi:hypothetical protein
VQCRTLCDTFVASLQSVGTPGLTAIRCGPVHGIARALQFRSRAQPTPALKGTTVKAWAASNHDAFEFVLYCSNLLSTVKILDVFIDVEKRATALITIQPLTEESDCTHVSLTMKEGKSRDLRKAASVRLEESPCIIN